MSDPYYELAAEDCERRIAAALAVLDEWDDSQGDYVSKMSRRIRRSLQPSHRVHVFGGVRFEETGEVRLVRAGEWSLPDPEWPSYTTDHFVKGEDEPEIILRYAPEVGGE